MLLQVRSARAGETGVMENRLNKNGIKIVNIRPNNTKFGRPNEIGRMNIRKVHWGICGNLIAQK